MSEAVVTQDVFHACVLIPVYNHPNTIKVVCDRIRWQLNLSIVLVDDGSDSDCALLLDTLSQDENIHLTRLPQNAGKGHAVRTGLRQAQSLGFSHALQLDADAQQDIDCLPAFLSTGREQPDTLAIGYACYDDSVPKNRLYGRYATHIWVWINTLSLDIRDSMCGVRLYPLKAVNALLDRHDCTDRMAFDTEILVRWHWSGNALINLPVAVNYPVDGISHFRLWRDNCSISWMHTRLFFGMLWRSPRLLWRKLSRIFESTGKRQ